MKAEAYVVDLELCNSGKWFICLSLLLHQAYTFILISAGMWNNVIYICVYIMLCDYDRESTKYYFPGLFLV